MIGRLRQRADFERLLAVPPCLRSTHFAVHHVPARPHVPKRSPERPKAGNLSTDNSQILSASVDNSPDGIWLGQVLPKRHARRAVTRSMLRRQVGAAVRRHAAQLACGLWLVRLRVPLARTEFVAADSRALRKTVAAELDALLGRARP